MLKIPLIMTVDEENINQHSHETKPKGESDGLEPFTIESKYKFTKYVLTKTHINIWDC